MRLHPLASLMSIPNDAHRDQNTLDKPLLTLTSVPSSRRNLLRRFAAIACATPLSAAASIFSSTGNPVPETAEINRSIIDTHIHLFDPTRAGGVPWPLPSDRILFRPALPERYRQLAAAHPVIAAIAIECSPLASDNDWLLKTVSENKLMVGAIGDLDPALKSFPADLERLHANPLFLGIRYGNLWDRDLGAHLDDPQFIEHIKLFASTGLLFESANPNPKLIADLLRLSDLVPSLRIMIDHLPHAQPPTDPALRSTYLKDLERLSQRSEVFIKGSEIVRQVNGTVSRRVDDYRPWLDTLWALFGEDRILFGSDWPNSETTSPLDTVFTVAQDYLATKGPRAARKFFLLNSARIYRWHPRTEAQRKQIGNALG